VEALVFSGGAIPKVEPVPEPVDEAIPEEKQRDDIVAVQLQEAIDWETDPELKAALEAELERYTKPSVDDAPTEPVVDEEVIPEIPGEEWWVELGATKPPPELSPAEVYEGAGGIWIWNGASGEWV
jgi:hypothetical protein